MTMIDYLKYPATKISKAYLSGGMEKAGEYGKVWREKATPYINSLGYSVWNPYIEERKLGVSLLKLNHLKQTDKVGYKKMCEQIVNHDLEHLQDCSAIICRIDESVLKGAGTYGELTVARLLNIPVYAWIDLPNGIQDLPAWCFGCLTDYVETNCLETFLSSNIIPRV